jgi:hypothetical protein
MPNCDFYAADTDFSEVLEFVFTRCECQVFESYSPFDTQLVEFGSASEVMLRYPVGKCGGTAPSVLLSLVPPSGRGLVATRRIDLKPGSVPGASFRHTLDGWGMISLQLGGVGPKGLVHSHTNHNSEARARAWAHTHPELPPVEKWDWAEVAAISSRLNAHIRKRLAVSKLESRVVLREASKHLNSGMKAV